VTDTPEIIGPKIIGKVVITDDEERQDRVARRLYGEESGNLERLLEANQGLAERIRPSVGMMTFGTVLALPEAQEPAEEDMTRPWE